MKVFWENLNKIDQFSDKLTLYINFELFKFLVALLLLETENKQD